MKDVRVVIAVITLLRHLCWICLFAFLAQIAYNIAPSVAESCRPQFITQFDSTQFDHTKAHHRRGAEPEN